MLIVLLGVLLAAAPVEAAAQSPGTRATFWLAAADSTATPAQAAARLAAAMSDDELLGQTLCFG